MSECKWMRIKFDNLQIFHRNPTVDAYYSITYNEKLYFSSVFDDQSNLIIKNDIIIPLEGNTPEVISLQRWQSHVIVFDHQIYLGQLKTKSIIKKKFQARKNQIVSFSIILCGQNDIMVCETLIKNVSQHYLLLQNIRMRQQNLQKRGDIGACFFKIITSQSQFDIPVQNGNCLIYLPQTFQIEQYKNGNFYARSKLYKFQDLTNIEKIQLYTNSSNFVGKVQFDAVWIVDQTIPSPVQYLLLHSAQILLWQFQLKFDNPSDFVGSKMKVSCNNKLFQFNDQLGNSKMIRIKKCCWIVSKSENDHVQIKIQRNNQILSRVDILIEQIQTYDLLKYKQKLIDSSNPTKSLGMIKFNLQRSKGGSNPQNLSFWKQSIKKKSTGSILIQQISAFYREDQRLCIVVKIQNDQKRINKISNVNFFQEQPLIYHNPVLMNPKADETLYFMIKPDSSDVGSDDFVGIAILNSGDIKLGKHPYQIDFYKNQQKMGSISCLITKYLPLTFVKSIFQPQMLPLTKILDLQLSMNTMTLSPYFFSYKYDNKSEVFCIIQVNKIKKVLILEPTYQQLSFVPASTSDNLAFSVDVDQIIKLKITIMIGDGLQQVIYGSFSTTIKMQQLRQKQQINKKQIAFTNFAQTYVGKCNILIKINKQTIKRLEKSKSKQKLPFQGRNKSSNSKKDPKNDRNKSISLLQYITPQLKQEKQVKIIKNLLPVRKNIQKDYANSSFNKDKKDVTQSKLIPKFQSRQSVKLPHINDHKRKESFNDLFVSMNVRKRTLGGYDYNNPAQDDKTLRQNKRQKSISNQYTSRQKGIDYQNLRDSNPNIDRNFQILFPPKKGQTRQQQIKNELNKYEQKLRGLKSVLNEISNDIDPIEPSIKDGGNNTQEQKVSVKDANNFEYAGNQFL